MKKNNAGFTLIELLVVVLIIGILSSIALPQYTKAVKKARGAEALTAVKALADAQSIYYMANGSYSIDNNQDNLDIQIPELKYFSIGTGGYSCNSASGSVCGVGAVNKTGGPSISSLIFKLDGGKVVERKCSGSECSSYFNCTPNTDGYCYLN